MRPKRIQELLSSMQLGPLAFIISTVAKGGSATLFCVWPGSAQQELQNAERAPTDQGLLEPLLSVPGQDDRTWILEASRHLGCPQNPL